MEDEDTAGGILSYEELAAMEMKMQVSGTICCRIPTSWHLLMKLKNGELAELKEQQNVKMPQVDMSFDNLVKTIIRWTRLHI